MAKWSEQVKVCSGTMVEGPLSDGYSWRKYGQKDILGANHPRLETLTHIFLFPSFIIRNGGDPIKVRLQSGGMNQSFLSFYVSICSYVINFNVYIYIYIYFETTV